MKRSLPRRIVDWLRNPPRDRNRGIVSQKAQGYGGAEPGKDGPIQEPNQQTAVEHGAMARMERTEPFKPSQRNGCEQEESDTQERRERKTGADDQTDQKGDREVAKHGSVARCCR